MILYRSYDTPLKKPIDPLPQNVNIWKAARCSRFSFFFDNLYNLYF